VSDLQKTSLEKRRLDNTEKINTSKGYEMINTDRIPSVQKDKLTTTRNST
jgi:hypothetical protein